MDMIVIDKEFLKGYKSLLVGLENCDAYEIDIDDIQDVYCKAKLIGKKKNEYRTDDGFIKIASRASQTIEYSILRNQAMGTEGDIRLMERLQMCVGCADMTSFSLKDKNNQKTEIYVPYDSLEGVRGNEIELSNCPSFEVDEDGNMIIAFGERSKQPKRKDNNYNELIAGWEEAFGDFCPKKLKVKIISLSTFGIEKRIFRFILISMISCIKKILQNWCLLIAKIFSLKSTSR